MAVRATHVPSGTDIAIGPLIDPTSRIDNRKEPHGITPPNVVEPFADTWRWLAPGYDY